MSDASTSMTEREFVPSTAAPAAFPWWRLFYWSVRRELWENRAIVLAPAALVAVVLVTFMFASHHLPHTLRAIEAGDVKRAQSLYASHSAAAVAAMVMGLFVAFLYSLNTLHNERRDRSLLFWKSLPVSDLTTVLAKATVPMVVVPVVTVAIAYASQVLILAWSTLVVALSGLSPASLWAHEDLGLMWAVLSYGLFVNALWMAPIFCGFLLISAWARRSPVLWALGLLAAPPIVERLSVGTSRIWAFESARLFGGFAEAFSIGGQGKAPIRSLADLDPARTFSRPDLWIGLVAAGVFLALAVWLRHRREPG